jgi:hypothetical protein
MVIDVAQAFGLAADPFAHPPGADPEHRLTLADAQRFVAERIAAAGGKPGLFTPAAIETAWRATGGRLGRLRWLGGLSMVEAALDGASRVDAGHVESAAGRSVFTAPPPVGRVVAGGPALGSWAVGSPPSRTAPSVPGGVAGASLEPVWATGPRTAGAASVAAGASAAAPAPRRRFGLVTMAGAAAGFLALTLILFPPPVLKTPPSPLRPTRTRPVEPRPDVLARVDPSPALPRDARPESPGFSDGQDRGFGKGRLAGEPSSSGLDPEGRNAEAADRARSADAQPRLRLQPDPVTPTAATPLPTPHAPAPPAPRTPVSAAVARTAPDAESDRNNAAPIRAPVRVFVHYSSGDREAAEAFADTLARRGFAVSALREVDETPGRPDSRYFYENDARAAQAISRELSRFTGVDAHARSFERYGNPPSPGTIEVWLPPTE